MKEITSFIKNKFYYKLSYDKVARCHLIIDRMKGEKYPIVIQEQKKQSGKKQKKKINIVFMGQMPSLWAGLKSIYESALCNDMIQPYLLALPEKKGFGADLAKEEYQENKEFEFLKGFGYQVIDAYMNKCWFDIRELAPDYVFYERPYDVHLPKLYRSQRIGEIAKICYVPYSYSLTPWTMSTIYNLEFLLKTDLVFCENEEYSKTLNKIFRMYKYYDKTAFGFGFPRFDRYKLDKSKLESKYRKTVIWMPRWSLDAGVESTSFFKYYKTLLDYFVSKKDICFICRPHPYMLRYFIDSQLMTQDEISDFLNLFVENEQFFLDEDGDYYNSLKRADIVVSDFTSLISEILLQNKPIIYCGKRPLFSKELNGIQDCLYYIRNEEELTHKLDSLLYNDDSLLLNRRAFSKKVLDTTSIIVGKKIIDTIIDDYK